MALTLSLFPLGWQHYLLGGVLIGTGVALLELPISNVFAREAFRHHSYLSPVARAVVCGLGVQGYALAVEAVAQW